MVHFRGKLAVTGEMTAFMPARIPEQDLVQCAGRGLLVRIQGRGAKLQQVDQHLFAFLETARF
jgi:hypothetical protein